MNDWSTSASTSTSWLSGISLTQDTSSKRDGTLIVMLPPKRSRSLGSWSPSRAIPPPYAPPPESSVPPRAR
eukprot:CAMPEP_0198239872 /NCGR_PEP_ID=MMETSP1446-20131203/5160_1 /TAXON_ID=1461542 ORGANISM="Unidentified sp, Strain CCMP2111" /NCGR_SAMPLE_ID=MMETSP1446 /ASSEMBLY_ACC=CAM_ASM_001112 /LENGTH=70 /DNA_ID=CAMNT_0043922539 /DNA_START=435 /DNA_END=644 /DNA_ORIENTATION=-